MMMLCNFIAASLIAAAIPQESALSEKEKIEALIAHVAALDAVFIRNGEEYPPAEAADHMRRKLDYAGARIATAAQFIEHIASKSSMSGEPYLIRFKDGREVESGPYLAGVLRDLDQPAQEHTEHPSAPSQDEQDPDPASHAMQHFEPLMGDWEGTLAGPGPDSQPVSIAINWKSTRVFDGRWIRFEFTSKEPNPAGRYLEWEGLFTANPETGEVETVWMTPRLRTVAAQSRFLDGRMIFFEKGTWDDAGRVLTLIAHKQNAPDEEIMEVKSTFTIAEDGQSFTVVDEEKQADGSWKVSGTFQLKRKPIQVEWD